MSGASEGYIKNLVVLDRRLGCADESATDEEQAEKILYYYPEDVSVYMQLSSLTMIESLIEFSAKFSEDPIDVVLMEGTQWGFYQCEPDIWIIVGIDTQISTIEQGGSVFYYKHTPNGEGLVEALQKMYFMYNTMFGSIGVMLRHAHDFSSIDPERLKLTDEESTGWKRIRQVASLRKVVRKLRRKCAQIDQDIEVMKFHEESQQRDNRTSSENLDNSDHDENSQENGNCELQNRDSEHLGIRSDASTLKELNAARDEILVDIGKREEELEGVIGPVPQIGDFIPLRTCTYTPLLVKYIMTLFCQWYMASGELLSPSGLTGMWGMHFSALGNPSYFVVERLRSAVRTTLRTISPRPVSPSPENIDRQSEELDSKCLILYDGQVIWNDFFDHDVMHFYELIRLQENNSIREAAQFIRNASSVSSSQSPDESNAKLPGTRENVNGDEKTNALRKLQTFSRRFSVNRRNSSNVSASKLQQKNSQDLIESYTSAYKNRKGYLTKGWNCVDLMNASEPSAINISGQEGSDLMSYHCEMITESILSSKSATHRHASSIWCPRVFSSVQNPCIDHVPSHQGDSQSDTGQDDNDQQKQDSQKESKQSLCLGRAVVYQESGFTIVVMLPNWATVEEFHFNLSKEIPTADSPEINVFSFCTLLQMNLSAVITSNIDEDANMRFTRVPLQSPQFDMPEGVSFICCNNLNVAFKAVNVYRSTSSPLLAWPSPLSPGCENILPLLHRDSQNFPLSCGQLTGSYPPNIISAINDVRASMSKGYKSALGDMQEACIRVTSAFRGGIWVVGRSLGDRHIVFILEGCSTLNDVHEVVNRVLTSFLGNILL